MTQARYLLTVGFLLVILVAEATHIRSIELVARRVDCTSNTYELVFTAYLNPNTSVQFGGEGDLIFFGDGETFEIPPQQPISSNGIAYAQFTIHHTYARSGKYLIGYREVNRGESIANMDNSISTPFFVEMEILIEPGMCNTSPRFLVPPIDGGCSGKAFYHHLGAVDPDGDSLSYEFITPRQAKDDFVKNYRLPNVPEFYQVSGLDYNKANEDGTAPPTLSIDPVTGLITWDAPGAAGTYSLAVKITEWRFRVSDSTWNQIGFVTRDMEIEVASCSNGRPTLSDDDEICVLAGTLVDFTLAGSDPDNHPVMIVAYSELFDLNDSPAIIDPSEQILQSTAPPDDTAAIRLRWQTNCEHVRRGAYSIVFKIQDKPPTGQPLVRFHTVRITVLAAPPQYESVSVNPVSKEVTLQWKDQGCDNVTGYQVWRRVAPYEYNQPECLSGMPHFLRYQLVGETTGNNNAFVDNNVAVGAMYCYRLVALIGPGKNPSRLSIDTCLIPKPAEAPVITNVSVRKTASASGEILVRWTPPFDIDPVQYPPPYQYRVYRASGMDGNAFEPVSEILSDTSYADQQINTTELPYRYMVQLYVPSLSQDPVDTSSVASSVYLTPQPLFDGVRLTWEAATPWYNYLKKHPYHLVYRSTTGDPDDFVLIDSVDVNEYGFVYEDRGSFGNQPLDPGVNYYYKVKTRGGYGNPQIPELLENFSQISEGVLLDITPPCNPQLTILEQNCNELPCPPANYFNQLEIVYGSQQGCSEPDLSFEIWAAADEGDEFALLATTREASYIHGGLESKAFCYKVVAVDGAGNRSDFSQTVCADNCPWFSLPNVFTPGLRDDRNDVFMAFNSYNSETECARFVEKVDLKILNRWGREIHFTSVTPEDEFIFWDGLQSDGSQVSSGVYYYEATIYFNMRNPDQKKQRVKGWVQVVAD